MKNLRLQLGGLVRKLTYAVLLVGYCMTTGCTNASGARMGLFSGASPVLAILYGDLFIGEAVGYVNGTGTIDIQSAVYSEKRCVGEFRYTGMKTGIATVTCNDGARAKMQFNSLSMLSGYGFGVSDRGPASFTYGLTPEEASEYLRLPEGSELVETDDGPKLQTT
jgi:hypothetical protein